MGKAKYVLRALKNFFWNGELIWKGELVDATESAKKQVVDEECLMEVVEIRKPSRYNQFIRERIKEGKTFKEAVESWNELKGKIEPL